MTATSGNQFEALKMSDDSGEEERELKTGHKLPPLEIPAHHHQLQHVHCLWFTARPPGNKHSASFDQNLKLVGRFGSVEQFWSTYGHCVRPHDMKGHCDYHLFKEGIKPMWEDDANSRGGKWIVRLRKGLASRCWENLVLALLGEQFLVDSEICGAVVSVRHMEDIISVWNRTAADVLTTGRIRDTLKRVLNLPQSTIMEYKTHTDSLRDNSSFRNTDLFVK